MKSFNAEDAEIAEECLCFGARCNGRRDIIASDAHTLW